MDKDDITLTYFYHTSGRAFTTNVCLFISGVEYADVRMNYATLQEEKVKDPKRIPFGSLPVLTVNGNHYVESGAHARWAGKRAGLYPSDPLSQLRVDELFEVSANIMILAPSSSDPVELKRQSAEYAEGRMATILAYLSSKIIGPFFMGEELSIADLQFFSNYLALEEGLFKHLDTSVVDPHPKLVTLASAVKLHPMVAEFLKAEPSKVAGN